MTATIRTLLFGIAGAALFAAPVHAQYYNPYAAYYQAQLRQQMWMAQAYYGTPYSTPYAQPYVPSYGTLPANMPPTTYPPSGSSYGVSPTPYGPTGYDSYSGGYNPYNPYYSPYSGGYGSTLMGTADTMRAYGSMLTQTEQARIIREQARQAKLDTKKKQIEFELYVKSITPTYNQQKERDTKATLQRMLTNPVAGEITNGTALNVILDDLRTLIAKKGASETILLTEGTLSAVSVTKGTFGLGVLRDHGRVVWPAAVLERMKPDQEKALNGRIQELVRNAMKGKLDNAGLMEVRKEIDMLREELVKKVNDIPTTQYLDAKRFLQEFDQATVALERGEAQEQGKFQTFVEGGKSIQDVVEYMVQKGLRFGPASANAEQAYRAIHTALATYDLALNAQVADAKGQ